VPTASEVLVKSAVTHTVTYFVAGATAYTLLDYPSLLEHTTLGASFRPLSHPLVLGSTAFQPIRGLLFGLVFYMLKQPLLEPKNGWQSMWMMLASIGIFGTFGAPPGSIEGVIYTELPISLHLTMLPEVLIQSFFLSWVLWHWVNHPNRRWVNWVMGTAFLFVLAFPTALLLSWISQ
jgi:hypothetical protein